MKTPRTGPGNDFELLDACHRRMSEHLTRLEALLAHLD